MPRTAEQLEQVREESRERILDAALRLFAQHGYAATSVRRIAAEAGISQGLLYNYYEGKAGLLQAIYERSMADVQASFALAAEGGTPGEQLERLVLGAFALVRRNLPFWRLTYQLRLQAGVLESLDAQVRAWTGMILQQLEALLRAVGGAAPATEARVLFAAIDGAAQHYALDPQAYPLDDVGRALVRRFVHAAASSSPPDPERRHDA